MGENREKNKLISAAKRQPVEERRSDPEGEGRISNKLSVLLLAIALAVSIAAAVLFNPPASSYEASKFMGSVNITINDKKTPEFDKDGYAYYRFYAYGDEEYAVYSLGYKNDKISVYNSSFNLLASSGSRGYIIFNAQEDDGPVYIKVASTGREQENIYISRVYDPGMPIDISSLDFTAIIRVEDGGDYFSHKQTLLKDENWNDLSGTQVGWGDEHTYSVYSLEGGKCYYVLTGPYFSSIYHLVTSMSASEIVLGEPDVIESEAMKYVFYSFIPAQSGVYSMKLEETDGETIDPYVFVFDETFNEQAMDITYQRYKTGYMFSLEGGSEYLIAVLFDEDCSVEINFERYQMKSLSANGSLNMELGEDNEYEYVEFTPSESGVYLLSDALEFEKVLSGDFCEVSAPRVNYPDKIYAFIAQAGRTYYIKFFTYDNSKDFTISIEKLTVGEIAENVYTPIELDKNYYYCFYTFTPSQSGLYMIENYIFVDVYDENLEDLRILLDDNHNVLVYLEGGKEYYINYYYSDEIASSSTISRVNMREIDLETQVHDSLYGDIKIYSFYCPKEGNYVVELTGLQSNLTEYGLYDGNLYWRYESDKIYSPGFHSYSYALEEGIHILFLNGHTDVNITIYRQ